MVRPREKELFRRLEAGLRSYQEVWSNLPGISSLASRHTLIEQMIESIRRVKYVEVMRQRPISERRTDPNDSIFDPLKASVLFQQKGQLDEAFWMVFLFVHFGKNVRGEWQYVRRVYGRLGARDRWNWCNTSADPSAFSEWLNTHKGLIKSQSPPGGFGNHRKYQSLDAFSKTGTGIAFETYVKWVDPPRTHRDLFEAALDGNFRDPRLAFDDLYNSMASVASFGRTARFDYLTMVGKLGLASVEPGSPYLQGSTGPLKGACLLFGDHRPGELNSLSIKLAYHLCVGMQVMEDALCNWQKSPSKFIPFRG